MNDDDFETLIEKYCHTLAPLFDAKCDPFDYVLALLRASGNENAGWDTLEESFRVLDDLHYLSMAELPSEYFSDVANTRIRLKLLAYAHLVEMAAPYEILANLSRVRIGLLVAMNPFVNSSKTHIPNVPTDPAKKRPKTNPSTRIAVIKRLTKEAGMPAIGMAFDDFYRPGIRNAISHSDYIIHEDEFRMRGQTIPVKGDAQTHTSVVKLGELCELIDYARAFYLAFVRVEKGARLTVGKRKGHGFPYDHHYKGILEALTDKDEYLCGAVIHWPNGTESRYARTAAGSQPLNLIPINGALDTLVGMQHSPHDAFSPLLKPGESPRYTPLHDSTEPLVWKW